MLQSSHQARANRCKELYEDVKKKNPDFSNACKEYVAIANKIVDLCTQNVSKSVTVSKFLPIPSFTKLSFLKITLSITLQNISLAATCSGLPRLIKSAALGNILIPFNIFMCPSIPPNGCGHKTYDAFPQ